MVNDVSISNDERAERVEAFILNEAVILGVVRKIEMKAPKNPNKWGKTLAPWFTEECRVARHTVVKLRREHLKTHEEVVAANKKFRLACEKGRREFAKDIPNMLKF